MECIRWPSIRRQWSLLVLLITVPFLHGTRVAQASLQQRRNPCGYSAIISFGDSLADTGNMAFGPGDEVKDCTELPYGMTFFHRPSGRCSDGRLIIDFIAEYMGIPYLQPYLVLKQQQQLSPQHILHGVNFAVGGSTALSASFLEDRGIKTDTNRSLTVQIQWFKTLLPSLCPQGTGNCDFLASSLFLVGEIGGNDLNYLILDGRASKDEIRALFPPVIKAISAGVQDLITTGARTLVVPGNLPLGCNAQYQKFFPGVDSEYYDPDTGCIRWINQLFEEYNTLLLEELEGLRRSNPGAAIIYADYFRAAMPIFRDPSSYGLSNTLEACCGYYNATNGVWIRCSDKRAAAGACSNPLEYANWDGLHMTEAAYSIVAAGLLDGALTVPMVNGLCPAPMKKRVSNARNCNPVEDDNSVHGDVRAYWE